MEIKIRNLGPWDFSTAADIARKAFGTPQSRLNELARCVSFQPDGWLLAEASGEPAGMVGAVDYGPFASIGMMVVRPDLQRMGIGRCLMEAILQWIDERGCPAAMLEATAVGQPLYSSLGFHPIESTLRYQYNMNPPFRLEDSRALEISQDHIPTLFEFDRKIFGADRSRVLLRYMEDYPHRAYVSLDGEGDVAGYLICCHNQIGPWVSLDIHSARDLLSAALRLSYEEAPSLIIPAENQPGIIMLEGLGFGYIRGCVHMVKGTASSPVRRECIFGEASLVLG